MKNCIAILIGVATAAVAFGADAPPAPAPASGILRWQNGETISGEVDGASSDALKWRSPIFQDPLQLRWQALRRIDQPQPPAPVTEPFGIILRDGSHIYGNLTGVTDTTVSIHSERHGDATLKRSEVLSIRRIHGAILVSAGPEGDVGWKTARPTPSASGSAVVTVKGIAVAGKTGTAQAPAPSPLVPNITNGPGGAFLMPYWNRNAYCEMALPDQLDAEFRISSSHQPDFKFWLEGNPRQVLKIETWDDELVLTAGDQFKSIRKLSGDDHAVSLRICWDRKTGKCSVFTSEGELLTEWAVPEVKKPAAADTGKVDNLARQGFDALALPPKEESSGIFLQNKGRDLSLDFLRIRNWNGAPIPKIDTKAPRVELEDGRVLAGNIVSVSGDALSIREAGQDSDTSVPLADIDALEFSPDAPAPREQEAVLSYADGTWLSGKILSIKDGAISLGAAFSEAPLTAKLGALRQMKINALKVAGAAPEPPLGQLDKVAAQQTTIHGKFVSSGGSEIRFLPVGGLAPVALAKNLDSEVIRPVPADAKPMAAAALFYTTSGDVLPGNLRSIDRSGVEFQSDFVEATKLPANGLDAIQFGAVSQGNLKGFSDPGWRILKGNKTSVRIENETMQMDADTSIGHATVMQSSELKFRYNFLNFSAVRLRMFCAGTDGSKSVNLLLGHTGNQFISGLESGEGQFETQMQIAVSNEPVNIRIVIGEKDVELHINGVLSQKFPISRARRAGAGLIIEPAGLWGNNLNAVSLDNFVAASAPGRAVLPDVSTEARQQALMVPRFRKNDPPRHALLAANGDLLRGEVEAATASHFGFRSGMENLKVPLDRVKAVIWLKKPDPAAQTPVAKNPALEVLEHKVERQVRYGSTTLGVLLNFLKSEMPELKFKYTEISDRTSGQFQFGGQTIGETLDRICAEFDLHYHVEADGTIVIESAPKAVKNLAQKSYWLKPDAFPDSPSPKEILTGKGISFPNGASIEWRPSTGLLSMANTEANQGKLAQTLQADFGGILGSPTHWLVLTNGARLGLAVDEFGDGFVLGHHPTYGHCKIPMAAIYMIRTTAPEPNLAMRFVSDWRLVAAPEPVIPEGGGESSPDLGKDAKPFKLAMLGGGDFELSKEKGKVVVLDFWATWCGPCVKSLPGLIEVMSAFPADRVKFIGVNQGEAPDQVKQFLQTRGWKLSVALDAQQTVASQYGVDGIPHTVIVGPDGKIAWVKSGYSDDGENEVAKAVKDLLEPVAAAKPKSEAPAAAPEKPAS